MLTKLGKYEIEAELGSGGMGVVYRAVDMRLGRPVALKTMSASVAGNPDLLKRFYREAQAAGQLHHPNIVTIYDIDEADGIPFIAMELLDGDDLEKMIAERRELPLITKIDVIAQSCRGLHYAHQHGVIHRDVKPGNIVVLGSGTVKIVDFGIARVGTTTMTRTGSVMGTVMYMAPEQVRGQTVDARSDIFSVGVILYELLTYKNPFPADNIPAILFKIVHDDAEPLSQVLPHCPAELETIVLRALEKEREQRYQFAEDMALDLQSLADSLRRDTANIYLRQGERALQEHKYSVAQECLQKVLEVDSSHELAKTLLDQVRDQITNRQRTQKIEQYLHHAQESLESDQFAEAIIFLDEILRLDSRHEAARQLKQAAIERHDRALRISRHLERAEKFAAAGDFEGAKAELEAVLAIDRQHQTALKMTGWLEKEMAEQAQARAPAALPPQPAPVPQEPTLVGQPTPAPMARPVEPDTAETMVGLPMAPTPARAEPPSPEPPPQRVEPPPAPRPPQPAPPQPPPRRPSPPPARPAAPPRPAPQPPAVPSPAVPAFRPERVRAQPEGKPFALWFGVGALVVALLLAAGYGVWRFLLAGGGEPGYVELTAAPWAEVVSVQTASGERLNVSGQTPLRVALPAGEYVIELKNGDTTEKVKVVVEAGEVQPVHHTFPQVKIDELVDELVSQY